jgi:hypothetical protein
MQKANNYRLEEHDIPLFGQQTDATLDILMICEVYFFREEETLLHADAEIGDPFHFLSLISITNSELRYPDTVEVFFAIFYDIIEDYVQEDKQFHSHEFVVLTICDKHLDFWIVRV